VVCDKISNLYDEIELCIGRLADITVDWIVATGSSGMLGLFESV
jgi:hypothetical protein